MVDQSPYPQESSVEPAAAEAPLILSLDVGTSAVRAYLFDRLGRSVEGFSARRAHHLRTGADGTSETDPDSLLQTLCDCLDEVISKAAPLAKKIAAVATCTFVSNVMGVDTEGRTMTSLVTYADTRSQQEVTTLRSKLDEADVHQRTGCHFHASYLPARFLWLYRVYPDMVERISHWLSFGEYLELSFFGKTAVSYSVASWTGLLDRHLLDWDAPLLDVLPIEREQLSSLRDIHSPQHGLRRPFADRWPALKEVPWFPAVGDGVTANIGSGCVSPHRVALTVGTTSALRAVVHSPVRDIPRGLWCYRVDRQRSLPGGAMTEGGSVFAWMRNTLRLDALSEAEKSLAEMHPDAHGLTILPFLSGERAPGWAGHARATIHGLSMATSPLDIMRAALEALAYRIAMVFELLCRALPDEPEVVASGGAILRSPAWLQVMADVLNRPLSVSTIQEASARGSALLALESLGVVEDLENLPDFVSKRFEPDRRNHPRYLKAIHRQKALYEKLVNTRTADAQTHGANEGERQ